MHICVVSIFDRATEMFARPAFVHRPAEAIRSFTDEVNRKPLEGNANQLFTHPADYELHKLGWYDDNTGEFTNERERLARASDLHNG